MIKKSPESNEISFLAGYAERSCDRSAAISMCVYMCRLINKINQPALRADLRSATTPALKCARAAD